MSGWSRKLDKHSTAASTDVLAGTLGVAPAAAAGMGNAALAALLLGEGLGRGRGEQGARDERDNRRESREIRSDDRRGRGEGGDREEGTLNHLESDWAGRMLLMRYLAGSGDWTLDDDPDWTAYLGGNAMLASQIEHQLSTVARKLVDSEAAGSVDVDHTFHAEIQNGESIVGYDYLHGTNASVGDFQITGIADVLRSGSGSTVSFSITHDWGDIIDPNPQYVTDNWKSFVAEVATLGQAAGYVLHVRWSEEVVVELDENGGVIGYSAACTAGSGA